MKKLTAKEYYAIDTILSKLLPNPSRPPEGTADIPAKTTPQADGANFTIYHPKKLEDSFFSVGMNEKKGGWRINDNNSSQWAIWDHNGKFIKADPGVTPEKLAEWQAAIEKATSSWINELPEKVYIRFGDLPQSGKSEHWKSSLKEKGISVYTGKADITTDSIIFDERANHNGFPEIPVAAYVAAAQGRPIYLVTGKKVGYGSDNEPVLKNVTIIKKLKTGEGNQGFIPVDLPNPSRPPEVGGQSTLYSGVDITQTLDVL